MLTSILKKVVELLVLIKKNKANTPTNYSSNRKKCRNQMLTLHGLHIRVQNSNTKVLQKRNGNKGEVDYGGRVHSWITYIPYDIGK